MAFDTLSDRLQGAFKNLGRKGKVSPEDVEAALKEVRLALLEADVNYLVVKAFMKTIREKALGEDVLKSLTPAQQVIKVVSDELQHLMGDENVPLNRAAMGATTIMMVGLQGSGKTTLTGKLALYIQKKLDGKPFMIAADVYRPAAIDQLHTLGNQLGVTVYSEGTDKNPVDIVRNGVAKAKSEGYTHILIDTAGRLHIDETLMDELIAIKEVAQPNEIMLVADSMTGQDAVNVAIHFHDDLKVTGATLTKLDGDARGGAALSIRQMTGVPIKFVGTGEKLDGLEVFYPERMAQRILGMGDVMSLIEKAQEEISEDDAEAAARRMFSNDFNLEDYLNQMQQMKKMGSMESILGMLPGMNKQMLAKANVDPKQLTRTEAIIQSMTKKERQKPVIINNSRKHRIANGSGTSIQEVNRLLKQFEQSKKAMKQMGQMMKSGKNPLAGLMGGGKKGGFPF
ncbi:signal recognition particle protein [Culicoidibacter larvae]|uniref:Signal recognition particle protein n=1 Tax=Culicoidibacter larvae TaxID=2579976 RepID=A0A5R8Q9J3_9FIRM|nr:signal recognition particle protein [Culicoidibacter larvae]TLG72107.1 signal recognition particle protein [Culicoidibacter larvae]